VSEVATPEGHAPVLLEDRALQALDEPVGPGMAGFGAGMVDTQLPAGLIERSVKLGATVRQHP